jgi:hypothetical protein
MIIATTIRKDTSKRWERCNPILECGEFGYDITNKIIKIGDGLTPWKKLKGIMEGFV